MCENKWWYVICKNVGYIGLQDYTIVYRPMFCHHLVFPSNSLNSLELANVSLKAQMTAVTNTH